LSPYRDLKARLEAKKPIADGIFRSRFAWDQFLQGLAFVIPGTTALDTFTAEASPVDIDAPVEQPLNPPGTITFEGIALPRFKNAADFVVRMNNLQYLANADLDLAERQANEGGSSLTFKVDSELVTIVGENGTEVRLERGSQHELAGRRGSLLRTREIAKKKHPYRAAGEQYAMHTGRGRR
jgi:type IV pilus assembly protein PilN